MMMNSLIQALKIFIFRAGGASSARKSKSGLFEIGLTLVAASSRMTPDPGNSKIATYRSQTLDPRTGMLFR
jgi:hypothetical protein